tara:strand:+ start:910 stop:2208 length:1299 start_codon:yes stop_codon:yes gene_type:complete
MKIAVIGSGISGNSAAWSLHSKHQVTLYERRNRPGGHSATVDIDYSGETISVDTGFIVYNALNYPNLTAMFDHLGVATEPSDMSFSFSRRGGSEWSDSIPRGIFAQKRNMFSPSFLWMLREIFRFNRQCLGDLAANKLSGLSLGNYLDKRKFSKRFRNEYLVPMGSAIWSTPAAEMLAFPVESFANFFNNHRLLHFERPRWRTVTGGSRTYVDKLLAPLASNMRLGCEAVSVVRNRDGVTIRDNHGQSDSFDQVIMAGHSDQTLKALSDASADESDILSRVRFKPNRVYLHRDPSLMPQRKGAWAAWNYLSEAQPEGTDVSVTYWMNKLQGIDENKPLFISLNSVRLPEDHLIFDVFEYDHPQYDSSALAAQKMLDRIQGVNRTWFCGAWTGYGFHEDGLTSGLRVAEKLGGVIPWRPVAANDEQLFAAAAE